MDTMFNTPSFPLSWKPVDLIFENPEKKSKLFLGNIGSFNDKIFLMENKISAIVSICPDVSAPQLPDLIKEHIIIPILDSEKAEILNELDRVSDFIDRNFEEGNAILVHCMAGSSRSAAFVIGFLMRKNSWCFEKAYLFAKGKRAQVFPNSGFQRQLRIYERQLFKLKNTEN